MTEGASATQEHLTDSADIVRFYKQMTLLIRKVVLILQADDSPD
jgi:hypothetical protein